MQDVMAPTDITVADWLEVICAEKHEIPNSHPLFLQVEEPWSSELLTLEVLVTLAEVECLKRARRDAYMPGN